MKTSTADLATPTATAFAPLRGCATCDGYGVVRSGRMSPEADCDLDECPACRGESEPADALLYTCARCNGLGAVEARGAELAPCEHCDGEGSVPYAPEGDCDDRDDEPGDIDSDECFNPYTGGYDDDC